MQGPPETPRQQAPQHGGVCAGGCSACAHAPHAQGASRSGPRSQHPSSKDGAHDRGAAASENAADAQSTCTSCSAPE
eukprot:2372932-Rhodomonas_salina.1